MRKINLTIFCFLVFTIYSFCQCNLYGIQSVTDGITWLGNRLVQVNEETGAVTPIGPVSTEDVIDFDVSQFNQSTQTYYMLVNNTGTSQLYSINTVNGEFSYINLAVGGTSPDNYMMDIIMDNENNILYGFTAEGMFGIINQTTGAFSPIGNVEHLYSYFGDFFYSFYDRFSDKVYMVAQTEYTDATNSYSVFIFDPAHPEVSDTIVAHDLHYLFTDGQNGRVFGVFTEVDGVLTIKELNKTTLTFSPLFNVQDPYFLVLDNTASYNSSSKNIVLVGTTSFPDNDYEGFYVINLESQSVVLMEGQSNTELGSIEHGACTVLNTVKNTVKELQYNNPVNTELRVSLKENLSGTFNLYSSTGKAVKVKDFSGEEISLSTEELKSGLYFFSITTDNMESEMQKLIVSH